MTSDHTQLHALDIGLKLHLLPVGQHCRTGTVRSPVNLVQTCLVLDSRKLAEAAIWYITAALP